MNKTNPSSSTVNDLGGRLILPTDGAESTLLVRLEFEDPTAQMVFIAGSFNDWRPQVTEMIHLGGGRWGKELTLSPGVYEYLLVVDGRWVPDPNAKFTVPNLFGGHNCVLVVAKPQA